MLLVVGPVEPTPFGCRLSTLEGWCVACDVADPWPSAAAPLPDIFPSIVYRSSLSLSLPRPCCRSRSCSAGYSLVAGAPKCAKCAYLFLLRPLSSCEKKTTPRHEGCDREILASIPTRFFHPNSLFLRICERGASDLQQERCSIFRANHRPIRVLSSHGKDFQSVDQFSRHQATTTRIRAFFFSCHLTCGAGLAPVRFSTSPCAFSRRMVLLGFPSVKLPKCSTEELARREHRRLPGQATLFRKSLRLCAPSSFLPPREEKRKFPAFFFFSKPKPDSPQVCAVLGS